MLKKSCSLPVLPVYFQVLAASEELLRNNRIGYTQSLGIDALRKRIAQYYSESFTDKNGQPLEVSRSFRRRRAGCGGE